MAHHRETVTWGESLDSMAEKTLADIEQSARDAADLHATVSAIAVSLNLDESKIHEKSGSTEVAQPRKAVKGSSFHDKIVARSVKLRQRRQSLVEDVAALHEEIMNSTDGCRVGFAAISTGLKNLDKLVSSLEKELHELGILGTPG